MDTTTEEEMDSITEEELDGIETARKEKLEAMIRANTAKMIREAEARMAAGGTFHMPITWTIIGVVLSLSMWMGIILLASRNF